MAARSFATNLHFLRLSFSCSFAPFSLRPESINISGESCRAIPLSPTKMGYTAVKLKSRTLNLGVIRHGFVCSSCVAVTYTAYTRGIHFGCLRRELDRRQPFSWFNSSSVERRCSVVRGPGSPMGHDSSGGISKQDCAPSSIRLASMFFSA